VPEVRAVCPFLDQTDPHCASHLTLKSVDEALGMCADEYQYCPVFQKLVVRLPRPPREQERAAG
jgi:hypothetical protein